MMDAACAAPGEDAESGEPPGGRLKKLAMETVSESLNVKPKRQRRRRNGKGERETERPDKAVRTRCTLSCIFLQPQQQQQQSQRLGLSNDCTEVQQIFIGINFNLPQNTWHNLHRVGLGLVHQQHSPHGCIRVSHTANLRQDAT